MESPACIVVIDDQQDNLLVLEDMLAGQYLLRLFERGADALAYLEAGGEADLVLLDVLMPEMDGFQVCQRIKSHPLLAELPVLFLSGLQNPGDEAAGLTLGAEDFIHKPPSPPVVLARVRNHLKLSRMTRLLRDRNEDLELTVLERTREMLRQTEALVRSKQEVIAAQSATITAFCSLAEARDNETGNHIRRTQNYVRALAEHLRDHPRFRDELDDGAIQLLMKSAPLHDIGKVAIPDAILRKPGKLTPEEWVIMKRHAEYGRDAIAQAESEFGAAGMSFLRYAKEIAYGHHERWDGSGYPQGLAGDAIPLSARLMAVADVYDALISRRVYKPPFSHEQAVAMIAEASGAHFDPDVAAAMLEIADEFRAIALHYSDDEAASDALSPQGRGPG